MAVVYKARQPVTGRIVALKLLEPTEMVAELLGMDTLTSDFWDEARAMARVRHPHVAQILDLGTANPGDCCPEGTPYFVMEYFCNNLGVLIGEDFDADRESRRLSTDQALNLTGQLLSALARLHYDGLVHRDVKPFNLMLTDPVDQGKDEVRLIDFGLSKLRGEEPEPESGQVKQRPKGLVAGSPYYSAPEQEADPDRGDPRGDLYGAGVTLFRLLTGWLPAGDSGERRQASSLNPELDQVFDDFLDRALAPEPGDRFRSARAMLAGLDELRRHWESQKDAVCAMRREPDAPVGDRADRVCAEALRSEPMRVGLKQARGVFGLDDLWRPRVYVGADFKVDGDVVLDRGRGLAWQRGGSEYPLTRAEAGAYLDRLNAQRFGGRTGWRLPTVDELCTLLDGPHEPGDFCLEPIFATNRPRLWSADAKAFTAAWYVDADLGFVWWQDLTCASWVRAVRSVGGADKDGS